jgi:hypothetical protein
VEKEKGTTDTRRSAKNAKVSSRDKQEKAATGISRSTRNAAAHTSNNSSRGKQQKNGVATGTPQSKSREANATPNISSDKEEKISEAIDTFLQSIINISREKERVLTRPAYVIK